MRVTAIRQTSIQRFTLIAAVLLSYSSGSFADTLGQPTEMDIDADAFLSNGVLLAQESMDDLFEASDDGEVDSGTIDDLFEASDDGEIDSGAAESIDDLFGVEGEEESKSVETGSGIRFSGYVQNSLAYTYADPEHYSVFLNRLRMRLNGRLTPNITWQLAGRLQYDPVFEFENFYPDKVEDDQKLDGIIAESFLDIDAGDWEFRLGRQQIVWGEMVALFFADVVSALDLRQFILPDFETIRIPQWAVRAEYFSGDFHGDIIFIPFQTIDDIGEAGAEFFPFPVTPTAGVVTNFLDENDPSDFDSHMGFGARGSYFTHGWDLSLFYYTSMDRVAAFERTITFGPQQITVDYRAQHERIHQIGATVSKDLGSFVLKSEAVFTKDRLVSVQDVRDFDGLTETDELRYVIGGDWSIGENNINAQFFQTWFTKPESSMFVDEVETGVLFEMSSRALHRDVEPEIIWIRSLNRNEWLLELKVAWDFSPNWRAVIGTDIFEGPEETFFGRYDDRDRVYYELRYSF